MCDDAVDNFLFFVFWYVVYVPCFVELSLTATITLCSIKDHINVNLIATASKFVGGSERSMKIHFDFRRSLMIPASSHLSDRIVFVATVTL